MCSFLFSPSQLFLSYNGGRTAEDIIQYINGKANTGGQNKKPPSAVVDLDGSNFDSIALDPSRDVLVEFYAPCKLPGIGGAEAGFSYYDVIGCGHCKALAPVYEEVADTFKADEEVLWLVGMMIFYLILE